MIINEDYIVKKNVKDFRLLTEWVDRNSIIDAIENKDIVYIYYAGDNTVNRGYRTIEPFVLGRSTAGNLVLRAWQQAGASDTRKGAKRPNDEIPGWRLFRLDGITSFMKTFRNFKKERPNYNPDDRGMSEILIAVDFVPDSDIESRGLKSIDKTDNITQKLSSFDVQSPKFSSFYDAAKNKELLTKKAIDDLYGLVKFQFKKDPLKYIVISKNGRYWIDRKENESKYEPDQVYGNLNNLYRKYNKIEPGIRPDKSFIENQRRKFLDILAKEIS